MEYNLFGELIEKNEPLVIKDVKRKKYSNKDFFNDITNKNGNLLLQDIDAVKDLKLFTLNRMLSQFKDCILICNEVNKMINVNKETAYFYLYTRVRKGKRFTKWNNPYKSEDIELVKKYYNYSNKKAIEALEILQKTPDALEIIRQEMFDGGVKNE